MRIAILTNAPAPYRTPIFERIAETPGVEARVFFDSASGSAVVDHQPGYPHEFLQPAFSLPRRNYQDDKDWAERVSMGFALGYLPRLASFRPDVVVSGEFGWRTLNATVYAHAAAIPLLVYRLRARGGNPAPRLVGGNPLHRKKIACNPTLRAAKFREHFSGTAGFRQGQRRCSARHRQSTDARSLRPAGRRQ